MACATPGYQDQGVVFKIVQSVIVTLLLGSILLNAGWLASALRWRPVVFVGTISYGIYLVRICWR